MSYSRPSPSSVPFWVGTAYSRPAANAADFTYEPSALVLVPLVLAPVEVVATAVPAGLISVPIANGEPALVGNVGANAWVAVEDPLSSPTIEARALWSEISVPTALSVPEVVATSTIGANFLVGGPVYSRPSPSVVDFDYEPRFTLLAPTALSAPALVADVHIVGSISVPIACGEPALLGGVGAAGRISVESSLSAPALEARALWSAISVPIACGSPAAYGESSFDGLIPATSKLTYLLKVATPSGMVTIPVSSWSATLQTDAKNYVGAVIPNCEPWLATLDVGTEFVIYRKAVWPGGSVEHEMARAPLESVRTDRGGTNYTASIQGYSDAFPELTNPPSTRALTNVRTVSSYETGTRMRCEIDWILRPGMTASFAEIELTVSSISYFVQVGDEYMDVTGDL